MTIRNFVKYCLENGGTFKTLLVPSVFIKNPSLMNPTIINFDNNLIVNLRNVNYVLYHSEYGLNEHAWGPLCYLHPENEVKLVTHNIICHLDSNYDVDKYYNIDTSELDQDPLWEFVGLEDCRLVNWENKLFMSGVRRDTTTNGQGRMELSEIVKDGDNYKEISRQRMPAPGDNNSYCEKNWMPVLDQPYRFIKWCNPTEVVEYTPESKTSETVFLGETKKIDTGDLRGGSQVLHIQDKYIALVHQTYLYKSEAGRKNGDYYHRFVVWDEDYKLLKISKVFSFMDAKIEFSCGMCLHNDNLVITFGYQDNCSYLLSVPLEVILKFINDE